MFHISGSPYRLRTKIFLLTLVFLLISLIGVGLVVETQVVAPFEARLGENVMNIAKTVAVIPTVQQWVGFPGGERYIQPVADRIRQETKTSYVVVFDRLSRRYSHPVPERIGRVFVGGDERNVFEGEPYLSRAVGTLGPSLRAFVPIYRKGEIVGAVSVGTMLTTVQAMRWELSQRLIWALAVGGLLGMGGACFLAWNIKRSIRGLEPYEILSLLQEREVFLDSVREGIISVDRKGHILLLNSTARKILRVTSEVVGHSVEEVLPNTRLPEVLRSGRGEFDQEQIIHSAHILTNRVPLRVNGEVVGALASFRDMTEIQTMAEELTGVRRYLEALRIQKHEFLNQLQALSGLLHLGEYHRAAHFISAVVEDRSNLVSLVTRRIRVPEVGGLILAKMGRCRELDIRMELDENSFLGENSGIAPRHLVVVLGNILENALEAVVSLKPLRRLVEFGIYHESGRVLLSVKDRGEGIPEELRECILEKGISTKKSPFREGSGFGLYNVMRMVEMYHGELHLESSEEGTECIVDFPEGGANGQDSRTYR